ncbi:MAG: nitroreductase family protein [Alphaproteobacteria bacterium]|nr:nitroreductase family protein [Alphaproteobacteria bacterium]
MLARAGDFLERIRKRHTIRDFRPDPVPQGVIETCIAAAGRAPSGANHQPWHFVAVQDPELKRRIRIAAEEEERAFYSGRAGAEWLDALAPIGTDADKPFLEMAPWLIAVFAQRRGGPLPGDDRKNYYVMESVGLACGFLIAALHDAGLATLTHTPNPMSFLNMVLGRPDTEKPFVLLVVGKPAVDAKIPVHALKKKRLSEIMTIF